MCHELNIRPLVNYMNKCEVAVNNKEVRQSGSALLPVIECESQKQEGGRKFVEMD